MEHEAPWILWLKTLLGFSSSYPGIKIIVPFDNLTVSIPQTNLLINQMIIVRSAFDDQSFFDVLCGYLLFLFQILNRFDIWVYSNLFRTNLPFLACWECVLFHGFISFQNNICLVFQKVRCFHFLFLCCDFKVFFHFFVSILFIFLVQFILWSFY